MELYQYDHCPYCVRIHMMLGRKQLPFETITLDYADVQTPTNLIGKKMLPILCKDDNSLMNESLDILNYLDNLNSKPILTEKKLPEDINKHLSDLRPLAAKLYKPRIIHANINDFSTKAAKDYYENKFKKQYDMDFESCLNETEKLLPQAQLHLDKIANSLPCTQNIYENIFSMADIHLFASLRNLTIVKDLLFQQPLKEYMQYQANQANIALFFDQAT